MKFGHAFKNALEGESYPQHWVERAIPYRQLKKILGKVREELVRKGYDPDTLHKLLEAREAEYRLGAGDGGSQLLRPKLVVRPRPKTCAALVSASSPGPAATSTGTAPELDDHPELASPGPGSDPDPDPLPRDSEDEWVKIPLDADSKFFNILQTDVVNLDSLHDEEQKAMNDNIVVLGTEISEVARPQKGLIRLSKSDLYRWREIFELYLAAQVFFSTNEASGGGRSSAKAQKQLVWFQEEVTKRQLPHKFKLETSVAAYARFLELNATLLQNLQFQELNLTAVTKIIKSVLQSATDFRSCLADMAANPCPRI